jgi:hypothetical protein
MGFFQTLIPIVVETFGDACCPELKKAKLRFWKLWRKKRRGVSPTMLLERGVKFLSELEMFLETKGVLLVRQFVVPCGFHGARSGHDS